MAKSNALVRASETKLSIPGSVTATSLRLPENMTFEQWEDAGRTLQYVGQAVMWWVGDWVRYGERKYGKAYAQAVETTGYDYQTTANAAWVAGKVEFSRRRENLSFGHHAEVAALESNEQDAILEAAQADNLSRQKTRELVREYKRNKRLLEWKQQAGDGALPQAVEVMTADCIEALPEVTRRFSCLVADPPYNTGRMEWDRFADNEEYLGFTRNWLEAAFAVLEDKHHAFIFCPSCYMADMEFILRDLGQQPSSRVIWHHRNLSQGRVVKDRFAQTYEVIFHCGTCDLNLGDEWNDRRFDVQTIAAPQTNFGDEKLHQTQKPLELIKWLVETGSLPGQSVIDPFAGAGTTGVACCKLGRNCLLIEKDAEFADIARGRLSV